MWRWIILFASFTQVASAQPLQEGFYRHQLINLATPSIRTMRQLEAFSAHIDGELSEWTESKIAGKTDADSLSIRITAEGIEVAVQTLALSKNETLRMRVGVMPKVSLPLIGWPGFTIPNRSWCSAVRNHPTLDDVARNDKYFTSNCKNFFDANFAFQRWLILQLRREMVFDGAVWRDTEQKIDPQLEQRQGVLDRKSVV